jgi:Tol biopolymer transport system component
VLQAIGPVVQNGAVLFTAMLPDGYRAALQTDAAIQFDKGTVDQLSLAATATERWTEEAGRESTIVSNLPGREKILQAEVPVASANGKWLAFLREEQSGTGLWLRVLDQPGRSDRRMTPPGLNVFDMSFLHDGSLVFSAATRGGAPRLFAVDESGTINSLGSDEIRYPAVSPDGHWLAYSKLEDGNWHLWLRDLYNGETRQLSKAGCNNLQVTWSADSRTVIYASDCGRALWFTALCRRPIL